MLKHIKSGKKAKHACPIGGCCELLRVLADETRQKIIRVLSTQKEINANDIADHFHLSRPTISHHLNLMKRNHLLNARKQGKEVYYSFNKSHVIKLLESFIGNLRGCC